MRLGRWGRTLGGKWAKERVGLRVCTVVRPAVAEMALPLFTLCFIADRIRDSHLTWCVAICSVVAAGVSNATGEEHFPSSSSSLVLSHPLTSSHLPALLHDVFHFAASTQRELCSSSEPAACWRPFGSARQATRPGNVTSRAFLRLLQGNQG